MTDAKLVTRAEVEESALRYRDSSQPMRRESPVQATLLRAVELLAEYADEREGRDLHSRHDRVVAFLAAFEAKKP